ncbi:hypothetical protein JCGZ_17989 [Jatropha curcas]|uniref:SBP-type domain-containing protein n=1 Tax=Jatropha curcas TaxID=180498 RepID=A0A067JS99_JATCU|nr:hypothetical protein JCGZ_17989 [Jatropha curcas]
MGYNLKTPWRLAELENQNIAHIAQTTVSSSLGVHQAIKHCSVDLKLGNSGLLQDKLVEKFAGPGDYLMESSSSGSSKRVRTPSNGNQVPSCLVDGCIADLSKCRDYHRRHKVCELHSKTPKVFIKGQEQRFCQQCSRFHSLVEFDEGKRSCRKRLDGHNRRRRKPQPDSVSVNSARLFSNHEDLSKCRDYHRRHKVCELHSKTPKVFIKGQEQRFCQQCSRFHSLVEFDEGKRSCRKRLDGHNRRRRKPQPDSVSVNSARLFSNHEGTRYLQFGGSQIFSTSPQSSAWTGAVKPENDPMLYTSQSSLNFNSGKNLFPGSLSQGYRSGKQFPFLQCTSSSAVPRESVCQTILDSDSTLGSSCSSQKMFSDGANRVIDSNRALSLLSSPSAQTREIGLSHMVQPDLNPPARSLNPSLNFNALGMGSGPVESVLVSDGSSNANLHGQDMFQIVPDGSSANGSLQTLSFSWE